jgi:hypothetical protein
MKKLIVIISLLFTAGILFAQTLPQATHIHYPNAAMALPDMTSSQVSQNTVFWGGSSLTKLTVKDSIGLGGKSGVARADTQVYIIPVSHITVCYPYTSLLFYKDSSGTATIVMSFWQSNDLYAWEPCYVTSGSAYTKTFTVSASGFNYVDFFGNLVTLQGKYFMYYMIASNTASAKTKYAGATKFIF